MSVSDISVFSMRECPHCSGKSGFRYRLYLVASQYMQWADDREECATGMEYQEDTSRTRHGAYRCDDCDKIIKQTIEIEK